MKRYDENALVEEVLSLIAKKQEGGYWDFKKEWHKDNGDLLHDIICMANNICDRDAYIIIGIDEENDYKPIDISGDKRRKNTQNIVDFLREKHFLGGQRPVAYVQTITINAVSIDIIIVENSRNTPFVLSEKYEGVFAHNIYTRVMDSNTPKNKSADINNVEYLWKKRFRIDRPAVDKFSYYLEFVNDWEPVPDKNMDYFYKYDPGFTICCKEDEDRDGYEYYFINQINNAPSWYTITLRYNTIAILEYQGLALDGGRGFVIAPERDYRHRIPFENSNKFDVYNSLAYGFMYADSMRKRLLDFFDKKESPDHFACERYKDCILFFRNIEEKRTFDNYVSNNLDKVYCLSNSLKYLPQFPHKNGMQMEIFTKEFAIATALKQIQQEI